MKGLRSLKNNKNNIKDVGYCYDCSSPINYFGSVLIQNEKRKWNK